MPSISNSLSAIFTSASAFLRTSTQKTSSAVTSAAKVTDALETSGPKHPSLSSSTPAAIALPSSSDVVAMPCDVHVQAPPHGTWLSELSHTNFPLDARYPQASSTPIYLAPKFDYAWKATKLASLDPKPGEPGYFAALVRIADEPHIANAGELKAVVAQGQALFQALSVTDEQMTSAAKAAKTALSNSHKEIEKAWQAMLATVAPQAFSGADKSSNFAEAWLKEHSENDRTDWRESFEEWLQLRVELVANGSSANPAWVKKSQTKSEALCARLLAAGFTEAGLRTLDDAIHVRVAAVADSYTNQFDQLYMALGNTEALQAFSAFEEGLVDVLPNVAYAPDSAPDGRGRNARFGMAPCADVVIRMTSDQGTYVGVIVPSDDRESMKMLGGKCDPSYLVSEDGALKAEIDSAQETACKEFIEETGADEIGKRIRLDSTQVRLLNRLAPAWCTTLQALGCVVDDREVVWSEAAKERLEKAISEALVAVSPELPVPDTRTAKCSGYSTTVFEAAVDASNNDQDEMLTLLLTLQGGDDAAHYGFRPVSQVRMQTTHQAIFADYVTNVVNH